MRVIAPAPFLLASLASLAASSPDRDSHFDVVHVTVTRTQYTCPCDGSTSYTIPGYPDQPGLVSTSTEISVGGHPTTSGHSDVSSDSALCYTYLTADSVLSAPTDWSTTYSACTSTITNSVTTTSTLSPVTSTTTTTETSTTTAPTTVFTSTFTETDTTTTTDTDTTTLTVTSVVITTSTSTSTVATISGFLPIQSSLPGSATGDGGDGDPVQKRDVHSFSNVTHSAMPKFHSYPASVLCIQSTTSSTCSATTTMSTFTETATASTVSATVTSTITATVVPSATTTITTTSTDTVTDTVTTTLTTTTISTSTVAGTPTTVYAACATNNIADTYNGVGFFDGTYHGNSNNQYSQVYVTASNAYGCCVAAQNYPSGASQVFFFERGSTGCYIEYSSNEAVGAVPQSSNPWTAGTSIDALYTIGNGPNGYFNAAT